MEVIPKANLTVIELNNPKHVIVANNTTMTIKHEVEIEFLFENLNDTLFKTKFMIVEHGNENSAILGCEFLDKYDACINFKDQTFKINEKMLPLNTRQHLSNPEKSLIEKFKCFQLSTAEKIHNLIDRYKQKPFWEKFQL